MNICVCGWYFKPELMEIMHKWDAFFVNHRQTQSYQGNQVTIANVGLEFGAYDWYLKHQWQEGKTLFMHDDNEVTEQALSIISELDYDQCFLFSSHDEIAQNGGAHGRAFLCSDKFLRRLKHDGGFWYDEGGNGTPHTTDLPDWHNNAIQMFRSYLDQLPITFLVSGKIVVPGLKCGYRGEVKDVSK